MKFKTNHSLALLLLGALPLQVDLAPQDSAETAIQFYGGLGQYALINRGCDGQVLSKHAVPFQELSAGIEHKLAPPLRVGVRGSYIFDQQEVFGDGVDYDTTRGLFLTQSAFIREENFTINPYFNIEAKPLGIGVGYFWSRYALAGGDVASPVSFSLRLGSRRNVYVSASFLHHIPLYTGGYDQIGIGSGKNPKFDWWLGWGFTGPYDQPDLALFKANLRLQRHFTLNVVGRAGSTEGISESAIGLGLTYR